MKLSKGEKELLVACQSLCEGIAVSVDQIMLAMGLDPAIKSKRYTIMGKLRMLALKTSVMETDCRIRKATGSGRGNKAKYEVLYERLE